jgi:hypothetical protein
MRSLEKQAEAGASWLRFSSFLSFTLPADLLTLDFSHIKNIVCKLEQLPFPEAVILEMHNFDALVFAAMATSGSQTAPALPGGLVAWIVCNARKRNGIGGWLLFFYWQLYAGLVLSAFFFVANIQSYVPENFDDKAKFALFLVSAVPGLLLLLVQTTVATFALGVQTPDMLKLLRQALVAQVIAEVLAVVIDAKHFPDDSVLSGLMLVQELLWLGYFFKSARVRHVFVLRDWDVAVNTIHPTKLKLST